MTKREITLMIKNIIFDLGNVLVNVHFDKFKEEIIKAGANKHAFNELFELKDQIESGSISKAEFWRIIKNRLGLKISHKKFTELFSDIFTDIPQMKRFVSKLAEEKKYRLIILSNTNPYHYKNLKEKSGYFKMFSKFALSYKLKILKPSPLIYETVLKRYKIKADETLFIDDIEENCKAAESLGIKTVCYKDYKSFKNKFDKLMKGIKY